jgi:hypothetical protein
MAAQVITDILLNILGTCSENHRKNTIQTKKTQPFKLVAQDQTVHLQQNLKLEKSDSVNTRSNGTVGAGTVLTKKTQGARATDKRLVCSRRG